VLASLLLRPLACEVWKMTLRLGMITLLRASCRTQSAASGGGPLRA